MTFEFLVHLADGSIARCVVAAQSETQARVQAAHLFPVGLLNLQSVT